MTNEPRTLVEAVRYFADEETTFKEAVALRFPAGVHCPTCGRTDVRFIATRKMWECKDKHPRKQFSVKVGSIFEDSALPLDKWFVAMWAIANMKNGISSYELHRMLGITQKSAWHMLHRIRLAMKIGGGEKLSGTVEADETFLGGKGKNMHAAKRDKLVRVMSEDKQAVIGFVERSEEKGASQVRAKAIRMTNGYWVSGAVREHVAPGSNLMTDDARYYRGLRREYTHRVINHSIHQYVVGNIHTNSIENFWSLLKRTVKGTYVSVEAGHVQAYVDEQVFRFNERKGNDRSRFLSLASQIVGKRLQYKELIAHGREAAA
jgi:transposase-like protein